MKPLLTTYLEYQMQITVKVKQVYGVDNIYPVCPQAHLLARLANTKTLTRDSIKTIKDLGYEVKIEQPSFTI
jgi:hypothetical protein